LPKSLVVYSVSGGKDYESDGIVPEASGAAGKYIFQKQVKSYTAMTITGDKADHSDLPQNQQVVQVIQQYLLEPIKNNQEITRQGKKQDNDKNGQNNQN
ncbi:alpha/beta hydrolase, partial [Lactobacillus helveticus]